MTNTAYDKAWLDAFMYIMNKEGIEGIETTLSANIKTYLLPSDDQMLPVMPKSKLVTYWDMAFVYAAPVMWNALPVDFKWNQTAEQFRSGLKSHLFK